MFPCVCTWAPSTKYPNSRADAARGQAERSAGQAGWHLNHQSVPFWSTVTRDVGHGSIAQDQPCKPQTRYFMLPCQLLHTFVADRHFQSQHSAVPI